jgi:hypothetical protein
MHMSVQLNANDKHRKQAKANDKHKENKDDLTLALVPLSRGILGSHLIKLRTDTEICMPGARQTESSGCQSIVGMFSSEYIDVCKQIPVGDSSLPARYHWNRND